MRLAAGVCELLGDSAGGRRASLSVPQGNRDGRHHQRREHSRPDPAAMCLCPRLVGGAVSSHDVLLRWSVHIRSRNVVTHPETTYYLCT